MSSDNWPAMNSFIQICTYATLSSHEIWNTNVGYTDIRWYFNILDYITFIAHNGFTLWLKTREEILAAPFLRSMPYYQYSVRRWKFVGLSPWEFLERICHLRRSHLSYVIPTLNFMQAAECLWNSSTRNWILIFLLKLEKTKCHLGRLVMPVTVIAIVLQWKS